jgi:transcriptional regulator with XRE-family HTH domain
MPLPDRGSFNQHVATRLKALRKVRELTQQALAERAAVDRAELSRYEHGEQMPSLATFARLCEALGVDSNYFFRGLP